MIIASLFIIVAGAAEPEPKPEQPTPTAVQRMQELAEQRREDRRENRKKLRETWQTNTASQQEVFMVGAVENALSYVLDAPTHIGTLRLNAETGHVEITGLCIGNPKDFSDSDDAIVMDKAVLEADPKLLFSKEPVIHLVEATGVMVNSETSLKGNNLKRLMDNAMRLVDKQPKGLGNLGQSSEKVWRIEKGVLGGVTVNLITNLFSKQTSTKTIEPIEMSFLGEDGKGMTASAAVAKVLERLLSETGILQGGMVESPLGNLLGDILTGK